MTFFPPRTGYRLAILVFLEVCAVCLPPVVLRYALPALSPFLFLCTVMATQAVGLSLSALLALPMLGFVIWRRRGFCRYFCPVGWLVELCAKARPSADSTYSRVPQFGQWAALLTLGGAIASLPLFLLLDPLALFTGAAGAAHIAFPAQVACATGLAAVLILSLVFPLLWCKRLCPLGATQDLLAELNAALARRASSSASETAKPDLKLARRAFLGLGGGMAVSALAVRAPRAADEHRLRPPGAVAETRFSAVCIRCGNCVRSCPSNIIQPGLRPPNWALLLVPELHFDANYCLETCNACGLGCPTGAITALPLDEKNNWRIGLAQIQQTGCLLTEEKECSACALICPRKAIVEEFSRETYTTMVRVDAEQCNGCGACVAACPPRVIGVIPAALYGNARESGGEAQRLPDRAAGFDRAV
ncbi:MAG TPA: 4Fe-4S dicluster domain-containing protein [Candidatus Hydrogenedentes bacterium]|nr:4Fe-4S dicluster domain-containing protein [Candidatus Hydrogenedentota bacterium]